MAKPLLYPEWAATDTTLPAAGNTNKQRPKESLRNIGWDKGQIPTAEEWNWQFDNISDWVKWFDDNNEESKTFRLTGEVTGTSNYTNESGFSVTTEVDATPSNIPLKIVRRNSLGGVSLGDVSLEKTNGVSTITFPQQTNDSGFIKHSEATADNGKLQFSIGDNNSGDYFEFGHTQGGSFTPTTTVNSNGDITAPNFIGHLTGNADTATNAGHSTTSSLTNSITNNISILSGVISNGGTIPLPSGYSEDQCKWIVSMDNSNSDSTAWDWQEGVSSNHIYHICSATGRVVTATTTVLSEAGNITYNATANYIIIGYK